MKKGHTAEFYRDQSGCTASITRSRTLYWLKVRLPKGMLFYMKSYTSYKGARIALGKLSGGTFYMTSYT